MKVVSIKKKDFERPIYSNTHKNNYSLTIEEVTPLGYVVRNEIDIPTELIDELDAFMEQFSAKCGKEFERMKLGTFY